MTPVPAGQPWCPDSDPAATVDHYADGTYLWWHLSEPSPELLDALGDGWLASSGVALDVGCGLGSEARHLQRTGWRVIAVDVSPVALAGAVGRNPGPAYVQADVRCLPLESATVDACLDRGCFHYLAPPDRARYAAELGRVPVQTARSCSGRHFAPPACATTWTSA